MARTYRTRRVWVGCSHCLDLFLTSRCNVEGWEETPMMKCPICDCYQDGTITEEECLTEAMSAFNYTKKKAQYYINRYKETEKLRYPIGYTGKGEE